MKAPARKRPAPAPSYDDVLAIVRLIESGSRFTDFRLRSGDIEVEIHRANGTERVIPDAAPAAMVRDPIGPRAKAATAAPGVTEGAHVIKSPMVGTFYRSPEPGAKPFVKEGARVKPDTIVCIIEVMKLMNSVTAGVHGVVESVLVENAHMVEFGQPLIAIREK
jgi:acetyl-CoA carboxylase biotin carboxyl carrier protein